MCIRRPHSPSTPHFLPISPSIPAILSPLCFDLWSSSRQPGGRRVETDVCVWSVLGGHPQEKSSETEWSSPDNRAHTGMLILSVISMSLCLTLGISSISYEQWNNWLSHWFKFWLFDWYITDRVKELLFCFMGFSWVLCNVYCRGEQNTLKVDARTCL